MCHIDVKVIIAISLRIWKENTDTQSVIFVLGGYSSIHLLCQSPGDRQTQTGGFSGSFDRVKTVK